jgi:GTPase SAR1 family protein
MKVKLNSLSEIPLIYTNVDSDKNLKYIPTNPLPKRGSMYICGAPASGKSSLWYALLLSKPTKSKPRDKRYYNKYFDRVEIISNSMSTIPVQKFKLPEDQLHSQYSDEVLIDIIDNIKDDDNYNSLIVIDDCIRDLSKSKILCSLLQNRRHLTQNPDKDGNANLSIWITSQKYNMLNLALRTSVSHVILFKSNIAQECKAIKDELMNDLNKEDQEDLLEHCWKRPYGFTFINVNGQKNKRYHSNFDVIEI